MQIIIVISYKQLIICDNKSNPNDLCNEIIETNEFDTIISHYDNKYTILVVKSGNTYQTNLHIIREPGRMAEY